MTDPTPSVSEHCVRHACKRRELEMRERIATLEADLVCAQQHAARMTGLCEAGNTLIEIANSRADRANAALAEARRDGERLDSGLLLLDERGEFGEPTRVLRSGLNLRAAIDAAIKYAAIANQEPSHG